MRMSKPVNTEALVKVEPGRWHVEVLQIEDITNRKGDPATKVQLQVRAGKPTDPKLKDDQTNRVHTETINHYPGNDMAEELNQSQICLFAIQCGVTFNDGVESLKENLDACVESGEEINFNWSEAAGKHLVIEIEHQADREDKSKKYSRVRQGCIWKTDDPRVSDIPKDQRAIDTATAAEVF